MLKENTILQCYNSMDFNETHRNRLYTEMFELGAQWCTSKRLPKSSASKAAAAAAVSRM